MTILIILSFLAGTFFGLYYHDHYTSGLENHNRDLLQALNQAKCELARLKEKQS